jgi:activator of 2-hydroxyglutaryl-CoA dehydratase
MRRLLAEQTGTRPGETLLVPDEPHMTGALGAALWGETTA